MPARPHLGQPRMRDRAASPPENNRSRRLNAAADLRELAADRAESEFTTKKDVVARWLREMVVAGELRPGTRLRQQEIADALNVSATPVREAIRQLETEGYLAAIPHVGAYVAEVDVAALDEVYDARLMLEGHVVRSAVPKMTTEDMKRLRMLHEEFADAVGTGDAPAARRANYRLHMMICARAELPVMLDLIDRLSGRFHGDTLDHVPGRGRRSVDEHARLIKAIANHDADAAADAFRQHIESGRRDFHRAMSTPQRGKARPTDRRPSRGSPHEPVAGSRRSRKGLT